MDERDTLARIAAGDEAAFHQFYNAYADRIHRFALTMLRSRHLAEDVVQETLLAVWKGAQRFRGTSKVSTWVFGIARNQALSLLRREARAARDQLPPMVEPDPAIAITRQERVLAALDRLPEEQREVVFLAFYEGLSYRDIASMMEIPEGTVKSRMYHAKRALLEYLR
ncbi:MAG: RNA polymerase sigma factor [Candidatus Bipolaricaulota bacterium]|nr:MAG: RNA polymerase sigma factor [Candidatus Bipolaricaulota bacterium]